jgi:hypothetical protein
MTQAYILTATGIIVAAALIIIAWRASKRKRKSAALSLERKALGELTRAQKRFSGGPVAEYGKRRLLRYYKRLRIVMSVYMHAKYGVTVRDTIRPDIEQQIAKSRDALPGDIEELKALFDELEKLKHSREKMPALYGLYNRAIAYFEKQTR